MTNAPYDLRRFNAKSESNAKSDTLFSADATLEVATAGRTPAHGVGFPCRIGASIKDIVTSGLLLVGTSLKQVLRKYHQNLVLGTVIPDGTYTEDTAPPNWPNTITETVWDAPFVADVGRANLGVAASDSGHVACWTNDRPNIEGVAMWYRLLNLAGGANLTPAPVGSCDSGWSGTGVSCSGGILRLDANGVVVAQPTTPLTIVAGHSYQLVFTVAGIGGITVTPSVGATNGTTRSTAATFTETIVATDTTNLKFTTSDGYGDYVWIDNVSINDLGIAYDEGAGHYNGTIFGATWVQDSDAGYPGLPALASARQWCLSFTAAASNRVINSYAWATDGYGNDIGNSDVTGYMIEIWIKVTPTNLSNMGTGGGAIIAFTNSGDSNVYVGMGMKATGKVWCRHSDGGSIPGEVDVDHDIELPSTANLADSGWHYMAFVKESNSSFKTYVDGVLDQTSTHTINATTVLDQFGFGAHAVNPAVYFDGILDECRISKIAQPAEVIAARYAKGRKYDPRKRLCVLNLTTYAKTYWQAEIYGDTNGERAYNCLQMEPGTGAVFAGAACYAVDGTVRWDKSTELLATQFSKIYAWMVAYNGAIAVPRYDVILVGSDKTYELKPKIMHLRGDTGELATDFGDGVWSWADTFGSLDPHYSETLPTTWLTSHAYSVGEIVVASAGGDAVYVCATAHTSDVWATDLAAGKWTLSATKTAYEWVFHSISGELYGFFFTCSNRVLYSWDIFNIGNGPRWVQTLPTGYVFVTLERGSSSEQDVQTIISDSATNLKFWYQRWNRSTGKPLGSYFMDHLLAPDYTLPVAQEGQGFLHGDASGFNIGRVV